MHVTDLSQDLQDALLKPIVKLGDSRVQVILDPDGVNLNLTDYVDQDSDITISKRKSIRPFGSLGAFSMSEVNIRMINKDDYFNHNNTSSPFYHYTTRLYNDKSAAGQTINIHKMANGDEIQVGMIIIISDGTNSEEFTVAQIDTQPANYDTLDFQTGGSYNFSSGARVETNYLPGKKVTLKTIISGVVDEISQFVGILKGLPKLNKKYAEITLYDNFKKLLDIPLKANSIYILTDSLGTTQRTMTYTRADSQNPSDGELTDTFISIDTSKCRIGEWEITFISEQEDYIITGPDGIEYQGSTKSNTYIGTSTNYQMLLGGTAFGWSGDFVPGDKINFKTVCSLGRGVNNYLTIPLMIEALLLQNFGAGLDSGDLDTASFTTLKADQKYMHGAISFTQSTTVLKAIELLQQHILATLYHDNDGLFAISAYRPQADPGALNELSPEADIREVEQDDLGRIEQIVGDYNYDYDGGDYGNQIEIPETLAKIGQPIEIQFPAYHNSDRGPARAAASRLINMWQRGVKPFEIIEKWNYGLAFEINDQYAISSLFPAIGDTNVEIYEIEKELLNGTLKFKAYDLNFTFGKYLFWNNGNWNRGYVYW